MSKGAVVTVAVAALLPALQSTSTAKVATVVVCSAAACVSATVRDAAVNDVGVLLLLLCALTYESSHTVAVHSSSKAHRCYSIPAAPAAASSVSYIVHTHQR
eukprot:18961-Heterococcus_DN1.PRE.1